MIKFHLFVFVCVTEVVVCLVLCDIGLRVRCHKL